MTCLLLVCSCYYGDIFNSICNIFNGIFVVNSMIGLCDFERCAWQKCATPCVCKRCPVFANTMHCPVLQSQKNYFVYIPLHCVGSLPFLLFCMLTFLVRETILYSIEFRSSVSLACTLVLWLVMKFSATQECFSFRITINCTPQILFSAPMQQNKRSELVYIF